MITLKRFEWNQRFRNTFGTALFGRFPESKGFSLSKEVGHQLVVMITQRIVTAAKTDEVCRDQTCSLMDQLIKCMLTIGSRFSPNDGAGRIINGLSLAINRLTVALHIQLLQIGREPCQILVVWQHGITVGSVTIGVKNPNQCHQYREIPPERCRTEVLIHRLITGQQPLVIRHPDGNHQRKPNGRRQRIPPSYPIPKAEHVGRVNTKFSHFRSIGAHRNKML